MDCLSVFGDHYPVRKSDSYIAGERISCKVRGDIPGDPRPRKLYCKFSFAFWRSCSNISTRWWATAEEAKVIPIFGPRECSIYCTGRFKWLSRAILYHLSGYPRLHRSQPGIFNNKFVDPIFQWSRCCGLNPAQNGTFWPHLLPRWLAVNYID